MHNEEIIQETQKYVQKTLKDDSSGHDWWHIYRVWKTARYIAKQENANLLVVELAALLHDIADWKFHNGDLSVGPRVARQWLDHLAVDSALISEVCEIIKSISFKGAEVSLEKLTLEGQVVQDADRLDAIGAIGIGRTFAYGGYKGRAMHDPNISSELHQTFEAYKNHQGTTINHFYEKLLLIKDRMNTQAGKKLAEERHLVMKIFLQDFLNEWDCHFESETILVL